MTNLKLRKMKNITQIKKRLYLIVSGILFGSVLLFSCTDDFTKYNSNKNQLEDVGPKQLAALFSKAQYEGCNWLTTDNFARMSIGVGLHLSGFNTIAWLPPEQNELKKGWYDNGFVKMYSAGVHPLQRILSITSENEGFDAEHSVALIWKVFLMHQLTDMWGPIPYSKAGSGEEVIPYESQRDIYYFMFEDLNTAVTTLNAELQANANLSTFGEGDLIYNGDVSKWIKFANTMHLRLAIRISNIDPAKAKAEAEIAAAGETMDTNADDAFLAVGELDRGNGIPRIEAWYSNLMTTSMESVLKGYQDPRMQEFFSVVGDNDVFDTEGYPEELIANIGGYHGMTSGFESPSEINYFRSYSNFGPRFKSEFQYVTPINILHSAETHFLKAEGAWRGWSMGGSAESFYEKGIEVSIKQWREDQISQDSIQNYINSSNIPIAPNNYGYYDSPMTDIPVKFSADSEKQYEQIMTQKWLALFPISFEAWAEYRRTRLPNIYAKKNSANADIDLSRGMIVTRLTYSDNEKASQPEEVEKAVQLLANGNEDVVYLPLWWDVNSNGN
ncbi:MAG: SusD/RagB family nutrient-binding outer membrane lipoprotein [Oleispira sp.]|nr:SusD/RagB family nutrient-binding outer membrane lipoprotein [Oleispira sp.]